jgi:hypothetical protein
MRSFITDNACVAADRDALLESFTAELTCAAYHVVLRHGVPSTWLALQLDLWQALANTVKQCPIVQGESALTKHL